MADPTAALAELNAASDSRLDVLLGEVCTSAAWRKAMAASRPWPTAAALLAANDAAMAGLTAGDLAEAMAGHARIGAPREGDAASQREQAGVRGADAALLAELRQANAAYEAKFGQVFLVCATGRTAESMLTALHDRYGNDSAAETEVVRGELRKINAIRLNRLLDGV